MASREQMIKRIVQWFWRQLSDWTDLNKITNLNVMLTSFTDKFHARPEQRVRYDALFLWS